MYGPAGQYLVWIAKAREERLGWALVLGTLFVGLSTSTEFALSLCVAADWHALRRWRLVLSPLT